jgi:hypothetical protein
MYKFNFISSSLYSPRCGGCDEPITTEVFSVALGKSWHPGHFGTNPQRLIDNYYNAILNDFFVWWIACVNCKTGLKTDFVSDEEQRPFCDADCFAEFESKLLE